VLAEVVRVAIELDREVVFHEERVENPARLLFDLPSTNALPALQDASWTYRDDIVRRIRVGRHPNETTRVVLDLDGVSRYTVVALYNPYRILIDCERAAGTQRAGSETKLPNVAAELARPAGPPSVAAELARPDTKAESAGAAQGRQDPPLQKKTPAGPAATGRPEKPEPVRIPPGDKSGATGAADHNRVSMARQLGLGVSRIVIDPGHGGRDPGAEGSGICESQIVLDIALRVEKLLTRQPGVEVVLTRRTDVFVPLEERTQIANREQADLFLSIHANASRNQNARGIESYYLNFASNPDAEAVAARENSASERTMNSLPDIVKVIALNNKLDESKDFAALVQQALARRLRPSNNSLKDLGVKQAPFVVLIGAAMPSVLAEVSFVTNRREGQLLRGETYRQRIAEALADAVVRYKRALKGANVVATSR
jgi:N-acetylmuramoyl-L-alanine amidase